jgi:hypothetical protein
MLRDLGFNEYCNVSWRYHTIVNPKIKEKHPGLSDDGYLELCEEYGGTYKRSEVYIKDWVLYENNDMFTNSVALSKYKDFSETNAPVMAPSLERIARFLKFKYGYYINVEKVYDISLLRMRMTQKVNVAEYPFGKLPEDAPYYTMGVGYYDYYSKTHINSRFPEERVLFTHMMPHNPHTFEIVKMLSYDYFRDIDHALATGCKAIIEILHYDWKKRQKRANVERQ